MHRTKTDQARYGIQGKMLSSIYYRKLHPLGNQRLMPVQINEQNLTIYNVKIYKSSKPSTTHMLLGG